MWHRTMFSLDETDTQHVFHIAEQARWEAAGTQSSYAPREFADEGFIHLSYARQVRGTAARYYAGRADLLLLQIPLTELEHALKHENLLGGSELFPHLYAPLARGAVSAVARIDWTAPGVFELRAP